MTDTTQEQSRRQKSRARAAGATRIVYGSLLVAIGACLGIVIGSVSDTPRLLLERLRGPGATVDLAAPPAPAEAAKASPPLEAFSELQKGTPPPAPASPVSSPPPAAPVKPAAIAPAAAPATRAAAPAPAAKPAPPAPAASAPPAVAGAHTVVQVLSLAERAQADAMVTRLKSQGFQPYVVPMPDKSGRFRVRVRPGSGQSVAELEQKLRGLGMKTWITAE